MASNENLIDVTKRRNAEGFLRCLKRGGDVNGTDKDGRTALWWAIEKKYTDMVIALVKKRADANKGTDRIGNTPLMIASMHGLSTIVSLLIEKGASVNRGNFYGDAALIIASSNGHKDVVLKLIEKGGWINARNNANSTALHCATRLNRSEVVRVLLENRADAKVVDEFGKTALDIAKENNNAAIVKVLETIEIEKEPMRKMKELVATLRERVDGMDEERRGVEEQMMELVARMNDVELDTRQKEGQMKTLIEGRDDQWRQEVEALRERVNQLENDTEVLRESDSKWREEKRVTDLTIDQLEMDKRMKDEQIKALTEKLNQLVENNNDVKTELDKLRKENMEKERQLVDLSLKLDESRNDSNHNEAARSLALALTQIARVTANITAPVIPKQDAVENNHSDMKNKLFQLESKVNEVERVKYSDTVEIVGVEEKPREDLELILVALARVLGLSIPKDVIEVSRYPSVQLQATNRPRVIVVKFQKAETARSWLAAFKERRSRGLMASSLDSSLGDARIFINQKLTSFDKKLLRRVKEFAKDNEYKFVWVQEGKILLRKDQDSPVIRIKTTNDIPSK